MQVTVEEGGKRVTKNVKVTAKNKETAVANVKKFYKGQKLHQVKYIGPDEFRHPQAFGQNVSTLPRGMDEDETR